MIHQRPGFPPESDHDWCDKNLSDLRSQLTAANARVKVLEEDLVKEMKAVEALERGAIFFDAVAIRAEALEEAAKVAESESDKLKRSDFWGATASTRIATAIRALQKPNPTTPEDK